MRESFFFFFLNQGSLIIGYFTSKSELEKKQQEVKTKWRST